MTAQPSIFAPDFSETPYWWDGWRPNDAGAGGLPRETDVAIIGAGYAGISCALELAAHGTEVVVLEAELPGIGASTLSGGQVTGGVNVGKSMSKRVSAVAVAASNAAIEDRLREAAAGYRFLEALIARYGIDCDYRRSGRIAAAWTDSQVRTWEGRVARLNAHTDSDVRMLDRSELRSELASKVYVGGALINGAGHLHPAKFFGGLLAASLGAGAKLVCQARVTSVARTGTGYRIASDRGEIFARRVVIATNGYTGAATPWLKRRLVPVTSHQIATEVLPAELRMSLIPVDRGVAEANRVTAYYRYSPDGQRFLFGGRARFYPLDRKESAKILFAQMTERFPQLRNVKVSHSWGGKVAVTLDALPHLGRDPHGCYYAAGCNGSGVTMMTWLGHRLACHLLGEHDLASDAFGTPLPSHPLYRGQTWFMPILGSYFQLRDHMEKRR
jgi:glycine/D-amino acid oxidase-like deaminating enzyme